MTENSLKRAHLWFIRSGTTSPLTLGLFRLDIPDLTVEEEIMQLYTQNCHRWHEVFFQFDTQDHPPSLYMLADLVKEPRAAPQLKRMSFRIGRHIMGIAKYDAWSVLSASQELRTLDVMGFLQMEVGFGKNTPWDRLTAATFTNVDIAAVWTILPECGSLQYLNFQPTATRSSDFKYVSMVTLPALRELHLYIAGLKASSILDCLTTPNLSKLKLFHYEGPDPRPEAFHRFLSRSGCMLETLQFIDVSVTEEDFIEYIACPMLSGVTYADIRGELTEGIVRRLTLEESTSNDENDTDPGASSAEDDATATNSDPAAIPIFPSLRRLKLSRCDFSESEPGVFPRLIGEMISSRCQSEERRLTEVYMDVGEYGALEGSEPEGFIDDIYKKYKVEVVFDL
ncbi:hypothetical protein AX16_000707 [Volvariella volvacea WC 439]|nr:hypothetical protein AX16_000707 [Volvariella volvacea WC 439]